jgi:phage gp36-like protein
MSTSLQIESFSDANLAGQPRTTLTAPAAAEATSLIVETTENFEPGRIVYVGLLSREGCERAVVSTLTDDTTLTLVSPLKYAHGRSEPVTGVLGDLVNVYRALNVDNRPPAVEDFTQLGSRSIDAERETTYYTDSTGGADYWYRFTNYNPTTPLETDLADAVPVRGDDFGHYASLTEIRSEAGFENAYNLSDVAIDQQRRAAESEINVALGTKYTTPFVPVPDIIHTLTIQLAAGLLLANAYRGTTRGADKLKDARALIKSLQDGDQTIGDEDGIPITTGEGISSWPGEDQPRAFFMGDRF